MQRQNRTAHQNKSVQKKEGSAGCRKGVHDLYCGVDCKKQKKTVLVDWLEKRHGSDVISLVTSDDTPDFPLLFLLTLIIKNVDAFSLS